MMLINVENYRAHISAIQLLTLFCFSLFCKNAEGTCVKCFFREEKNVLHEFGYLTYNTNDMKLDSEEYYVSSKTTHHEFGNYQKKKWTKIPKGFTWSEYFGQKPWIYSFFKNTPTGTIFNQKCILEICFNIESITMTNDGVDLDRYKITVTFRRIPLGCGSTDNRLYAHTFEVKGQFHSMNCSKSTHSQYSRVPRSRRDVKPILSRMKNQGENQKNPKSSRTADKVFRKLFEPVSSNQTQQLVPTYRLPTIHTVPVRAVLIGPSNLIPEQGPGRTYNEATFWAYKFHVLQARCGVFQILSGYDIATGGVWTTVDQFTGDQVLRRQVRYLSTLMQPEDEFAVSEDLIHLTRLSVADANTTRVRLILPVVFTRIHLKLFMPKPLLVNLIKTDAQSGTELGDSTSRTRSIDIEHLHVDVQPPERDMSIYFTVLSAPKHGHLYLSQGRSTSNQSVTTTNSTTGAISVERMYLGVNSQFTQEHVRDGKLFYTFRRVLDDGVRLHAKDPVTDGFNFRIHVPGAQLKTVSHFQIVVQNMQNLDSEQTHIHATIRLVNRPAKVLEGGTFTFRSNVFYARQSKCTSPSMGLYFQLLALPDHGVLQLHREIDTSQAIMMKRFTFYPIQVIDKGLMVYQHDGSEATTDIFQYQFACQTIWSLFTSSTKQIRPVGEPVVGTFRLDIVAVNDNPPNLKTQPLFVTYNQSTPISARWITVTDQDLIISGSQDNPRRFPIIWNLVSELQRVDCAPYPIVGQFINSITGHRVDTFTMDDVIRGNLSFQHIGSPKGRVRLHVTDGKFQSSSEALVNVSKVVLLLLPPIYPAMQNSNEGAPLFFEALTNAEMDPRKIFVTVIHKPCNGILKTVSAPDSITDFTYDDVLNYRIYYRVLRDSYGLHCTENSSHIASTAFLANHGTDVVVLAVHAEHVTHTLHEMVSVPFHSEQNEVYSEWTVSSRIPVEKPFRILTKTLIIETGKFVPLRVLPEVNESIAALSSSILYVMQQSPVYGKLTLRTPSFVLKTINTFALADVLALRVLYELNNPAEYVVEQLDFEDCFVLFVILPKQFNTTWSNGKHLKSTVCVRRKKRELKFQTYDLTLGRRKMLSLSDANLQPFALDDVPIRHDQPSGYQNQDGIHQHVPLQNRLSFVHQKKSESLSTNASDEEMIFMLITQPKYGTVVSKRLNRSIMLFSSQDLERNDVFYINQQTPVIEKEDSIQLTAFKVDDANSTESPITLKIYLQSTDQSLRLSRNRSMVILVDSSVHLSPEFLAASVGPSNTVSEIQYDLRTTYGGYLAWTSNLYRSINKFTQYDIDIGRVAFIHNGKETATVCGFDFHLRYGADHSTQLFHYNFRVYRARIEKVQCRTLEAFPLGLEKIQPWHLHHRVCLEPPDWESGKKRPCVTQKDIHLYKQTVTVVYSVLSQPTLGRLVKRISKPVLSTISSMSTGMEDFETVQYFTQDEINNGQIFYAALKERNTWNLKNRQHHLRRQQEKTRRVQTQNPLFLRTIDLRLSQVNDRFTLNVSAYCRTMEKPSRMSPITNSNQHSLQFNISIAYSHVNRLNQDRLFFIQPVLVDKGGTGEFTRNNLNPRPLLHLYEHNTLSNLNALHLKLVKPPEYGSLQWKDGYPFQEISLTNLSDELKSFRCYYLHDGSESVTDRIRLRLENINDQSKASQTETGIEIPVRIRSTTDRPPWFIRPSARSGHSYAFNSKEAQIGETLLINCLVGLGVAISESWLYAMDDDSSSEQIEFNLISQPEFGSLCLRQTQHAQTGLLDWNKNTCKPCSNPCLFTQEDINNNQLIYVAQFHSITSPILDSFTVAVRNVDEGNSVNKQNNEHGTITLRLWPTEIVPQTSVIYLLQGEEWTPVDMKHVRITLRNKLNHTFTGSSMNDEWLWFKILQPPTFGQLCLDTMPIFAFSYVDLLSGRLSYRQISKSSSVDSFVLQVQLDPWMKPWIRFKEMFTGIQQLIPSEATKLTAELPLHVEVQPRVSLSVLEVQPGARITVNKEVFNTSSLWNLIHQLNTTRNQKASNVVPIVMFTMATQLRLGRFLVNEEVVVAAGYPDEDLSSTVNITLESFERGAVKFESYHIPDIESKSEAELEEQISFILWAGSIVQPARGSLIARIVRDVDAISYTNIRTFDRHILQNSGNQLLGSYAEITKTESAQVLSMTVIILVIGLSLLFLVVVSVIVLCIYRNQLSQPTCWGKQKRCARNGRTLSSTRADSTNQSAVMARLIRHTQSCETSINSVHQIPLETRVEVDETDVIKSSQHCTSSMIAEAQNNTVASCNCDFGGTVIYVAPTQHNTFQAFPTSSQFATSAQLNTDFVVLSDLSSTGLQVIAPQSTGVPATSLAAHICETAYTCIGQTSPTKMLRLSTTVAQTTSSATPTSKCMTANPSNLVKQDPCTDQLVTMKVTLPSNTNSTNPANVSISAQPCLIQITPYPTDTLTLTSVDSVPLWITHSP